MDTTPPQKPDDAGADKPSATNPDQDFEAIRAGMAQEELSQQELDRRQRIEYLRSLTGNKKPKKRPGKAVLTTLLIVVAVAALAGGVYWFFSRPSNDGKQPAQQNGSQQQTADDQPQIGAPKHYDSTHFGLGFDYPENWKVADDGNGKLTVTSSVTSVKTPDGTSDAQVVFSIQTKQPSLPGFAKGNGIATRTSEKIAYAAPTPSQRAQTYMTFVSFAGAATTGIDTVFITGDLGYQKDQAVPQADIVQGDPLVSMYFAKCNGNTCAADPASARVTVADSAWSDTNPLVKAVKAVLVSLTIN